MQHVITSSSFQPMANGNILIFVLGKLRVSAFMLCFESFAIDCILADSVERCCWTVVYCLFQSDEDNPMDFSETFVLANEAGNWCIMNDIFCLGLHDFWWILSSFHHRHPVSSLVNYRVSSSVLYDFGRWRSTVRFFSWRSENNIFVIFVACSGFSR